MKRTSNILFLIGKILGIIATVSLGLAALTVPLVFFFLRDQIIESLEATGGSAPTEEMYLVFTILFSALYIFLFVLSLVSLILAILGNRRVVSGEDARGGYIRIIIAGAIFNSLLLASGILGFISYRRSLRRNKQIEE